MRKIIGWMLVLALILCAAEAGAEGPVMAGLDLEESHHDWDNNTFLRKMEERTGVQFTYKQYNNASEYTVWKRRTRRTCGRSCRSTRTGRPPCACPTARSLRCR